VFLFDPPAIGSFEELHAEIGAEEWILHAASQDLACLREVGLDPSRIFDTELAARLLGFPRVGLGTVVEELLGIHLAKEHSAADWSTRPLPATWLEYAALDVELLVDVRDRMVDLLEEQDKTEIAAQEFEATRLKEPKPALADPWRKLNGVSSIRSAQGQAVARELWRSRDALGREIDTAPGRLIPDASIIAAALAMPSSKRELASLRAFSGRASRTELERWWAAVDVGRSSDDLPVSRRSEDTLPPVRSWAERNPEADLRLKLSRAALQVVSEERAIPLENLLTPEFLRRLAWNPPSPVEPASVAIGLAKLGARPWQIELTSQEIALSFVEAGQEVSNLGEEES
jgi:ribonuclease D